MFYLQGQLYYFNLSVICFKTSLSDYHFFLFFWHYVIKTGEFVNKATLDFRDVFFYCLTEWNGAGVISNICHLFTPSHLLR